MYKGHVLIVDDLPDVRATLSGFLSDEGYMVRSASSRVEALQVLDAERFHVAILDVRLDESDETNQEGLLLMREIKQKDPAVAVIILTGYASIGMVRAALQPDQTGHSLAFGFLQKTETDQLIAYVQRAVESALSQAEMPVRKLLAQGEGDQIEFKSSIRWDYRINGVNRGLQEAIAIAIAGMLNGKKGGTLLIGIADDGTVLGIEKDLNSLHKPTFDGFQLALADIVKTHLGVEHLAHIHPHFEPVNGKHVCVVSIDKSPDPVYLATGDHKFWVRMGNSTRSLDVKAAVSYIQSNWKSVG